MEGAAWDVSSSGLGERLAGQRQNLARRLLSLSTSSLEPFIVAAVVVKVSL